MMRRFMISLLVMICCLIPARVSYAQSSQSELLEEYQQFLEEHKDMSTSELLAIGLCVSGPGWESWGRGAATAVFSNITITGHVARTWELAKNGSWYNPINSPDVLYIALQDSVGRMGTIIHPDPMAVIVAERRHWSIPLSAFTGSGMDPTAIKRIYIGVGDRDNPQPNGTGWIHIDDICLTK